MGLEFCSESAPLGPVSERRLEMASRYGGGASQREALGSAADLVADGGGTGLCLLHSHLQSSSSQS